MKTLLTAVFLFSALGFSVAHAEPVPFTRVLSYEEVKGLSESSRNDYMNTIAKALTTLSNEKPKKISFFEQLFSLGTIAYAAPLYQCVGGGVPVDIKSSTCGVQSYAGFSCSAGKKICNPVVFGVDSKGQPTCHENATTKWCYQNTTLGTTNFLDPVFKTNKIEEWNALRGQLEQACNDFSTVKESRQEVSEACHFVRLQMELNEDVRKLMAKGYSYKNEGKAVDCTNCSTSQAKSNLQDLKKISAASLTGFSAAPPSKASPEVSSALASFASSGLMSGRHIANKNTATIQGINGRLIAPMPNCRAGDNYHYRGDGHFHAAQDLWASFGAPVQSVASGVVVSSLYGGGYGNRVVVMHKTESGEPFYSTYSHLNSRRMKAGEVVAAGTTIGTMGSTGRSTGAHLHFEIIDKNNVRNNPAVYYPKGMCAAPDVNLASL